MIQEEMAVIVPIEEDESVSINSNVGGNGREKKKSRDIVIQ